MGVCGIVCGVLCGGDLVTVQPSISAWSPINIATTITHAHHIYAASRIDDESEVALGAVAECGVQQRL